MAYLAAHSTAFEPPDAEIGSRRADSRVVRKLWGEGLIDDAARLSALKIVNGPLVWWPWIEKALLLLGLALTLAGVICFFAWNWEELPGLAKLGLVQLAIVACCGIGWQKGLDTPGGQAAQIAAAVLVGVFLAVFGQIYQTGADAYQLFVGWAALILPWVLMCRLSGLWLLWLAIVNLGFVLYWDQVVSRRGLDWLWLAILLGLLNGGAAALRERLAERGVTWLAVWLRWVLVPASLTSLAIPAFVAIVEVARASGVAWFGCLLLTVALALLVHQFRTRAPDLFALTCGAATVTVLASVIAVRILSELGEEVVAFFLSGLAILGLVTAMARWLMGEARSMRRSRSSELPVVKFPADEPKPAAGPPVEADVRTVESDSVVTVAELLDRLVDQSELSEADAQTAWNVLAEDAAAEKTPWFIQCLLGFGAWVACLLFMACFGIAGLFNNEPLLIIQGVGLLVAGAVIDRKSDGAFFQQFALAMGLTGGGLVVLGAAEAMPGSHIGSAALAAGVATAIFYGAYRSLPFRFLSTVISLGLLTLWAVDHAGFFWNGRKAVGWPVHALVTLETVGVGLIFWKHGSRALEPAGYACAMALLGTLIVTLLPDGAVAWPSTVVQVLAQLWLFHHATAIGVRRPREWFGASATVAALLGLLSAPGLLASIGLTVLGHLDRNVILKGLGLLFLPVYIAAYYYNLETTLLMKSLALATTGFVLWAARWYLQNRFGSLRLETAESGT